MGESERESSTPTYLDVGPISPDDRPETHPVERRLFVQEMARLALAGWALLLLTFVAVVAFLRATSWEDTRTLLDIFVPVIGSFLGAAAGFYFAEQRRRE